MNLFFFKKKTKLSPAKKSYEFYSEFLDLPHHAWIRENPKLKRAFFIFLNDFPSELFIKKQIYFIGMHDPFACSIKVPQIGHVITIQPNLIKLLHSADPQYAFAILAHELGHIFLSHSEKNISSQKAQIEADEFACMMGYENELLHTLENYKNEWGCLERIGAIHQRRTRKSESSLISSR